MADFYLLGNTTHTQMFGCVIKTKNQTVVIDGGTANDGAQLVDFLEEKSDSHVNAWFFTHPHHDHIGCFVYTEKNHPSITVDKLYYHFPDLEDASLAGSEYEAALWKDIRNWDTFYSVHKVLEGECFRFDEVSIRVLRTVNQNITGINNSSVVYRIDGAKRSILILGDLGVEGGIDTMKKCPLELLQADYTQMAHHGQDGVSKEFYDYIKPKRCIWAAPEWLWNNDSGKGFDSGNWETVQTREWMAELGVVEHFIEKDGIQKIEF